MIQPRIGNYTEGQVGPGVIQEEGSVDHNDPDDKERDEDEDKEQKRQSEEPADEDRMRMSKRKKETRIVIIQKE